MLFCRLLILNLIQATLAFKDYTDYKVITAFPETGSHSAFLKLLQNEFDIWREGFVEETDIFVSPGKLNYLLGLLKTVQIPHKVQQVDIKSLIEKEKNQLSRRGEKFDFKGFHRYHEILEFLTDLAQHTEGMDVIEMSGKTYEGRPIKGVRINPGNSKKKIFVDSGIHAREWIAPSTVAYLINQLATNRSLNEDIINAFDWYLFPVLNPDGYEYTFSKDRLWRKNRNPEISRTCPGIDLNRNWDYHWGEDVRGKDPCTELYAGPSPFSEPETQAIRDFLANLNADGSLALIVSFHSYVQVLMSPWSHTYAFPDDYSDLLAVMHATVKAIAAVHGREYKYGSVSSLLGLASGSFHDWTKGSLGVKHSYCFELPPKKSVRGSGFIVPPSEIIPTGQEIWEGVKKAAQTVGNLVNK